MTYTLELYLEKCADSNDERPYQGFAEDIGYDMWVAPMFGECHEVPCWNRS